MTPFLTIIMIDYYWFGSKQYLANWPSMYRRVASEAITTWQQGCLPEEEYDPAFMGKR